MADVYLERPQTVCAASVSAASNDVWHRQKQSDVFLRVCSVESSVSDAVSGDVTVCITAPLCQLASYGAKTRSILSTSSFLVVSC